MKSKLLFLALTMLTSCDAAFRIKSDIVINKISTMTCVKNSMREVDPQICIANDGEHSPNYFTFEWKKPLPVKGTVTLAPQDGQVQITIDGMAFVYGGTITPSKTRASTDQKLAEIDQKIKQSCK